MHILLFLPGFWEETRSVNVIFAALCWSLSLLGPLCLSRQFLFIGFIFKSSLAFFICTSDIVALGFWVHCGVVIRFYINWFLTMHLYSLKNCINWSCELSWTCARHHDPEQQKLNFFFLILPKAFIVNAPLCRVFILKGQVHVIEIKSASLAKWVWTSDCLVKHLKQGCWASLLT